MAAAQANLRSPAPGSLADHAAAAIARTHLYRALERQVRRLTVHEKENDLVRELHHATHTTAVEIPASPPTSHPVASELHQAAEATRIASDILSAQFDPLTGRPRSSEGFAVLASSFRADTLGCLAKLARAASEMDQRLATWLTQGIAAGSHQLIVRTAASDALTTSLTLPHVADAVASDGPLGSLLRNLRPPPLTDAEQRWTSIASPADCALALDVARTWLAQHYQNLTAVDLKVLLRAGLALTYEIDYLIGIANSSTRKTGNVDILASVWRGAARAANHMHTLGSAAPGVGPAVVGAAETWLRSQLRSDGDWQNPATILRAAGAREWQNAAAALSGRMPDLVTLVHQGALCAMRRGDMLEPDPQQRQPAIHALGPRWIRAGPASLQGSTLLRFTGQLREETIFMAKEADAAVLPGFYEAERHKSTARKLPRAPGMAVTVPDTPDGALHPASSQPSGDRRSLAASGKARSQAIAGTQASAWSHRYEQERTEPHLYGDGPEDEPSL
ncbi:hypothetical protein ACIBTZ_31830 [Micromonospora sp. NPDC049460]|uniref:hypothetical protein n=1 Tax=Micromonospora sp. NPDC049460 TaxID=3364272 RepID=UPI00378AD799